ncbi:hypothetical protein DM02DRAFT_676893 [Periconia macrospinosa]|uniref:Uncharacterized protein n=1 Tax=Periconia macrospinosa TaxID=97972 RepID=A0A2V1D5L9_9PLEO|nr:hypothetical protein DM02DRAFT_676893 [Periconia macrospinosa]
MAMSNIDVESVKMSSENVKMGSENGTSDPESFWSSMDEDTKTFVEKEYERADKYKKWSKDDQKKIKNASIEELEDLMREYMDQATQQQDHFKENASRRARAERGIMKFLDDFNAYVQAYKGVVDVMKGAGFGEGEAAYGALQLLLITAVHKQKTEDFIDKMLVELSQQYDRLQRLKPAYPTREMQKYRAVLYRLGVEFLHESVRYYLMSPLRRLGHLFARPPSVGVQRIVEDIKSAIRETEREMRAIDGGRINQIEQTQWQMVRQQKEDRKTIEETNTIVTALQIRNDNDRLDILRRLLHLDASNDGFDLEGYRESLRETFYYPRKLPPLDVEGHVFNRPEFDKWKGGTTSSIFFLHGATVAPEQTAYSWLSPAAVQLISAFSSVFGSQQCKESSTLLSHYLYQSSDTINSTQEKTSPTEVLSSLIHQVLSSDKGKRIIRNEDSFAFLKQSIDALENTSTTKQIGARCRRLNTILINVLKELDINCLVIVIDRIDKLRLGMENVMELLVELMERAKTTLKIFVTARSRLAFEDDDLKEQLDGKYTRLTINQDD